MALVTYDNPDEFKDEERWLKFFPKTGFLALVVSGFVWVILINLFKAFGIQMVGVIIGGIQCVFFTLINMITIPTSEYMKGGGLTIAQYISRRGIRHRNRFLYVKHWNDEAEFLRKKEKRYNEEVRLAQLEEESKNKEVFKKKGKR